MNVLNKLSRVLAAPTKGSKRKGAKRPRRGRRQRRPRGNAARGILAGYGRAQRSSYSARTTGDVLRIHGYDLVASNLSATNNISYFASANPVTWQGTRISTVARGYQNYRPIKFNIHYRPQVGSTSSLSMFIGTIWQDNSIISREAIEPTLVTSPGGNYIPAWQISDTNVPLGRRLPMRMFPIRDPSMRFTPFSVVCRASAGDSSAQAVAMPGRIFIEYEYELANPIGSSGMLSMEVDSVVPMTLYDVYMYGASSTPKKHVAALSSAEGWIVDMAMPPTKDLPLFSHLSTDFVQGQGSDGGTLTDFHFVKIDGRLYPRTLNDLLPVPSGLSELPIQLYTDVPPLIPFLPQSKAMSSSSSSSSNPALLVRT